MADVEHVLTTGSSLKHMCYKILGTDGYWKVYSTMQ